MGDSLVDYWKDLVPKENLDPIFGSPLRANEIQGLEGKVVCGIVYDSDVSNLGNGELGGRGAQLGTQGAQLGRTAFKVTSIGSDPDGTGSVLPPINIEIIDPSKVLQVCATITWSPALLTIQAKPFVPIQLNFTSNKSIQNVDVLSSSEVKELVISQPLKFTNINAGTLQNLFLTIFIPPSVSSGWHNGTISLSINGLKLSEAFRLNVFVPTKFLEIVQTPNGNFTYIATPAFSPFFNDTFDVSVFFTFTNGTTTPLRTYYDVFRNSTSGQTQSTTLTTLSQQNLPVSISTYLGSVTNSLLLSNFLRTPEVSAVIGTPVPESECTQYAIRYDFRNKPNIQGDLAVATDALSVSARNPLIIRADIFWKEVEQGHVDLLTGKWVHEGFNFLTIDNLFTNVVTQGKKAYVNLGVHDPPFDMALRGGQYAFKDDTRVFIEAVIDHIKKNGWINRVAFWQIDNEPNTHPFRSLTTGDFKQAFADWKTTSDALGSWFSAVKALDPNRRTVLNVYQASPRDIIPQELEAQGIIFSIEPFRNLLTSDRTVGSELVSNVNIMGFDIYPDQWVNLGETATDGLNESLQQADIQLKLAKNSFGFNGRWSIVELPAGPVPDAATTVLKISPADVSAMVNIILSTRLQSQPPALVAFFQLNAANDIFITHPFAFIPPFFDAYGLITENEQTRKVNDGTNNTPNFLNAIRSSVIQNCPSEIQFGSISGNVFNDTNANGVKDSGDLGLSGWIIKLTFRNGMLLTNTTNAGGNYTFANLPSGTYIVEIAVQPGFRKTAPILGAYIVELLPGQVLTNKDFGSTRSDP